MSTKALSLWAPDVIPDVQGAPYPAIINSVRNACIEFCERTFLWTVTLTPITIVAETSEYTLTLADNAALVSIESVKFKATGADDADYVNLYPVSPVSKDMYDSEAWAFEEAATPTQYWLSHDKKLNLYPIPSDGATSGLLVKVNQKPTRDCTVVEDFLYNHHFKAISAGAKSDLLSRKGQPWFDIQIAAGWDAVFQAAIEQQYSIKTSGRVNDPTKVSMRPLA